MEQIGALFGSKVKGPTEAEKAMQRERSENASKANAESDQRQGLLKKAGSLRRSLAYRDETKSGSLGG